MGDLFWVPVLIAVLVCAIIMVIVWLWAERIGNASVVDIFWAYNFPVIAIILLFSASGAQLRTGLLCGMVLLWGMRLGSHLSKRVLSHIGEEEGRYAALRSDWAPHASRKFFCFFQAQGISNVLLAVPFFVATADRQADLRWTEYLGVLLWVVAVAGESLADYQLSKFKRDPRNKGKVCNTGLWRYSRHPNYFFEWLVWVSYFVFAVVSPYGYLAVISPALILYLLLRVTGIPATEEQSLRSKGSLYKKYQDSTSAFVPWFPKK